MDKFRLAIALSATVLATCAAASGQVKAPQPRDANDLERRYKQLSCSLVLIQAGNSIGTGFYVSADGDIITASHVLGERTFATEGAQYRITIAIPPTITLRNSQGQFDIDSMSTVENNADDWASDLAVLRTHKPAPCWLIKGDDKKAAPGQHVLAMGFPGLAFGSLS